MIKRYLVVVQHEVIVYAEKEKDIEPTLRRSEFLRNRVNLKCAYVAELPPSNEEQREPIIETWERPTRKKGR